VENRAQKEIVRYERLVEELQSSYFNPRSSLRASNEILLMQMRKQSKEMQSEIKKRSSEAEHLKRSTKVTKV
jgi:hypothetical protein